MLTDGLWKTEVVGIFRGSGQGPRGSAWNMKSTIQDSMVFVCVYMCLGKLEPVSDDPWYV